MPGNREATGKVAQNYLRYGLSRSLPSELIKSSMLGLFLLLFSQFRRQFLRIACCYQP
jgi:hypothetical protein